ncbi:N-acetylmuramoyl-L-alanine amidase family protein [Flavobacterium litorale]|uniref:N-acetylmuramoyl-L-alanine amidase n=1 Tax=Flavobacterium litorale TaxID=2856519 RepID=A0ABX8VAJ0_9FLAO|nr:N-acetylmuramoyl-L-alanine amidase [Flavobacterium litorale]QYJ67646.1 N-acetylmuramoyl-L-alanine amidase [Flavobacterium litorale]
MMMHQKLKLVFLVFIMFCGLAFGQSSSKFIVVLDAGHGGKDSGAMYHGVKEKDVALAVVLKVGKLLAQDPEIELVYTRKTDVFIPLNDRATIANDANATIFVSIHCNGAVNQSAYGTETFVMGLTRNASNLEVAKKENAVITLEEDYQIKYKDYDPNKPESLIGLEIMQGQYLDQSIHLASKVQDGFTNTLKRKNRGVKQAGFLVLRNVYMPRILIELGFLSHMPEGKYLKSETGQNKLSDAIAKAIKEYKKEYHIPIIQQTIDPIPVKEPKPEAKPIVAKPQENKTEIIDEIPAPEMAIPSTTTTFRVQIAASSRDLETKPSNFKGLESVSKIPSGSLIKYFYGETMNYEKAKKLKEEAILKGFPSAFVVAFRDGKKISINEALK